MPDSVLIGLDWGTSNRRAYRFGADGGILEKRADAGGILAVPANGWADSLAGLVGDWLTAAPDAPVLLSGMVGSRQGWAEAPYLACPAGPAALAGALWPVPMPDGRRLAIVPGLTCVDVDGVPDVMRGEETEILGSFDPSQAEAMVVLPGTHSKWVAMHGGLVTGFATFLTGELYAAVRGHTILGRLMPAADAAGTGDEIGDPVAFALGVQRALDGEGRLLHRLFSVRTEGLFDHLASASLPDYLAGLLIGAEVSEACKSGPVRAGTAVTVVAGTALRARYAAALELVGLCPRIAAPDGAARGLWRIAAAAGFTGTPGTGPVPCRG